MSDSRILTFGIVFENDKRDLNVHGFHIHYGERFKNAPTNVPLLTLIKERIEKEINYLIENNQ